VRINDKTIKAAQEWNELPLKVLREIIRILYSDKAKLETKKIECIGQLLGLPFTFFNQWEKDAGPEFLMELNDLLPVSDFLFMEVGENQFAPSLGLTDNPLPIIKANGKKLYGPKSELENISFYEWSHADTYYLKYFETQDAYYLNKLIAVLYRPAKELNQYNKESMYEGDQRLPLLRYEETLENRIKDIDKLDQVTKWIILHFFASCRKLITDSFQNIFKQPEGDPGESNGNDYGWAGVILELAGDKFGDDDQTAAKPLYTILIHLSMQEDQRVKADMERTFNA